jgi:chromosome segregation protein
LDYIRYSGESLTQLFKNNPDLTKIPLWPEATPENEMIIKKLELQGFKSFPERTKIVFHPGITAIVGPNGTGKSNIVDAILWVLGGQRQKGLRGDKTEHIIFNGNTKKPPLGMAEVSLLLQHDEEETAFSHRVFRSGESEYRLNGKAARLKDIQDALWKQAVAEKEYFVIEQGSIGLLLTAKPAEKRLLLEEAAGTAFYKDKKKEAQSKLASSEQNLIRLEDIISEVARAKNSLQRQAQAATRYRKLREKIRQLTGLNFKRKLDQLERRHEEAARQHGDCLNQEKELTSHIKSEERQLAEKRREAWELEKSIKENQDSLLSLESQISRGEAEKERETRRSELLAEKINNAAAAAAELKEELSLLETEISQRQTHLTDLEKAYEKKKEEADKAKVTSLSVQEDFSLLEKAIETLRAEQLLKLSELTELRNEAIKTEKELDLLARQEAKLEGQLEQEGAVLRAKEEALQELERELAEDQKALEEQEKNIAGLNVSMEEMKAEAEKFKSCIDEARKARDETSYSLRALQKMEEVQKKAGPAVELPEALGQLADLVEADPESTALIDALWKEEATASIIPALDFLKRLSEKNLEGRFLLVSPAGREAASPALDDPNVLGSVKSRLRPHPKIKAHLGQLREAVIVRDVKAAVDLWLRFPSLNFITPSGDLLLSSGLLRLGKREEGAFVLRQEIRKLEDKIASREAELAQLSAEFEKGLAESKRLEEKLRHEISLRADLEQKFLSQERTRIASNSEREKTASLISLLDHELEILRRDRAALGLDKESLFQKISLLEAQERSLKARLEAEEKEFFLSRGKNVEGEKYIIEIRAEAELIQEKMRNAGAKLQELSERQDSLLKKITAFEEEARLAEKERAELQEIRQALETKARNLEEKKRVQQARLLEREADLQRLRKEEEEREKKLAELREEMERKKEDRVRWEILKAEIDRDLVNLEETCWQELKKTLHEVKNEPLPVELSAADVEDELGQAEEDLQKFKAVNLMAEEEYVSHKERYDFLVQQRNDLRESIDATQEAILKIDEESKIQFLTALAEVNKSFQEVFTLLFKGGSAEVKLVDESDPLESGLELIAQPPGKKVQNISLLSGGEKSLTSLAFLFALFRYKPTPFCILDEVDAALDDVNLARFLDLAKNLKKDTQFIIVTHNYKTMEVADYIYGTTMAEPNITKLYSVKLEKQPELIS